MRKLLWILVVGIFLSCQSIGQAASVDILVQKLVEKGILSSQEATQLKGEITYQEKNTIEEGSKKQVPDWVQNTKLTGDFRLRNQWEKRINNSSSGNGRDRLRIRARLGLETKVNDTFKMALGIASSGGTGADATYNNARSNNQTFTNGFQKGTLVLNYAYGQWTPNDRLTLTGGQMKNPIWEPMEFLWDSDITPTGASAEYNYKVNDMLTLTSMGGFFTVTELSQSNADPYIFIGQLGAKGKLFEDKADYKLVAGYQNIQNGTKTTFQSSANNTIASSKYVYRYNTPMVGAELGLNDPIGDSLPHLYIPRIAVFGEFAYNPNPKDENNAYMIGAYMGNSKVSSKGAWKATWAYKVIGRDAWSDLLPDSDFYGGNTDVKGYEGIFEYGLAKNITMQLDFYSTQRMSSLANKAHEYIMQTDLNWKF